MVTFQPRHKSWGVMPALAYHISPQPSPLLRQGYVYLSSIAIGLIGTLKPKNTSRGIIRRCLVVVSFSEKPHLANYEFSNFLTHFLH